jgi:hypothetical protein
MGTNAHTLLDYRMALGLLDFVEPIIVHSEFLGRFD